MARKQTLRKYLKIYLSEHQPQTTGNLYEQFNADNRHGVTMNALGNVLAKDPSFFRDGMLEETTADGERIRHALWYLIE